MCKRLSGFRRGKGGYDLAESGMSRMDFLLSLFFTIHLVLPCPVLLTRMTSCRSRIAFGTSHRWWDRTSVVIGSVMLPYEWGFRQSRRPTLSLARCPFHRESQDSLGYDQRSDDDLLLGWSDVT